MAATKQMTTPEPLDKRDARALTSCMSVLDEHAPAPADAPGLYMVVSDSGKAYVVEPTLGTCECGDMQWNDPDGGCAHIRRVQFATDMRTVPRWCDTSRIDPLLLEKLEADQ